MKHAVLSLAAGLLLTSTVLAAGNRDIVRELEGLSSLRYLPAYIVAVLAAVLVLLAMVRRARK